MDRRLGDAGAVGDPDAVATDAAAEAVAAMPPLPAGTVTFLLTDVEGSSRLWEADPAGASAALEKAQTLVRDATTRHRGVLPVEQGEGDSSVSAFVRASDAAACAVEIQQQLAEEHAVRVRIALHTGEAETRPDGTYRGAALNRCARLRAIGHGGQILLSQATYEVLVDGLDESLSLRDCGTVRLRDLARPEHVWQLCHTSLYDAFPPLRSFDTTVHNVPTQLTSFVGREREVDAVSAAVRDHRLVTLTGAGGSGKTRLAVQVAARLAEEHRDGIWWVDLAPLADPALVPAAVAAVVGVRESPVEPITDTLARFVASLQCLLVLDNCEHLIDACAALSARLTQDCPDVTLLATSREPLRVAGEHTWPVPPLSLRPNGPDSDGTDTSEAVRLFVDRARAVQPTFSLSDDNAGAVAEICERLDGIPLAIELAAARARVLSVEQIASGLNDRFHLLTGGARTALPRQRTLESSVDWSHDLLDDDERRVFRRLAVFAGTFTLEAAEAVCGAEPVPPERVLDLLSALVDRSLVQIADEAGAQTRYRMLETIRDYSRHKLTDAGEAESTRDRHLDHYVSLAEEAARGLDGSNLVGWLARVDAELDNLRAAMDWSVHSSAPGRGARIVGLLCLYWFSRSELAIGRDRLEATLAGAPTDGVDRAGALVALSIVHYMAGAMDRAASFVDDAISIAQELGDSSLLGRALHWRAWVRYWGHADRFAAWAGMDEAAARLGAVDDAWQSLNFAVYAWSSCDTSEALRAGPLAEAGLALTRPGEATHGRCYCLMALGYRELVSGEFEPSIEHLGEALDIAQRIGDHYAEICARVFTAYNLLYQGRYVDARATAEIGLDQAIADRGVNTEAFMRFALGTVDLAEGRCDDADAHLEASFRLLGTAMPFLGAITRGAQAQNAIERQALDDAARYADEALRLGQLTDTVLALGDGLHAKARARRLRGDFHRAEDLLHEGIDLAVRVGRWPELCDLLDSLAGVLTDQERSEEAVRIFAASHTQRAAMGGVRFSSREPRYQADLATARAAMPPDEFERAWEEGTELSLDDAVAYTRRGRGRRKRPAHGWASLTPTERQVVELVVEGLTNPRIGERLFISKRTVQTHLANVFGKLGVSTRAELAAAAARRAPDDA